MNRRWIKLGASIARAVAMFLLIVMTLAVSAGQQLWSLKPLIKPEIPTGEKHPIDAFIRAKLAEKKIVSSARADGRTLLRRLYFDVTGLPPTPEEVEAYPGYNDPQAFEIMVDQVLKSPRHGERWARHWLDAVHYADTHGNDHDYGRPNAWPYRDYVIRSLNDDKPYGQFIQEQIAGDVLFPQDPQAIVALGFLAAGPWDDTLMVTVREDTEDHRLSQVLDRDNMVSTVMSTIQSMTVHCARCHDHKFDPVSQRDYYALQAVFAGVDRADRPFDAEVATHVRRNELAERKRAIARRDPELLTSIKTPEIEAKINHQAKALTERLQAWKTLDIISVTSAGGVSGITFTRQPDASWYVGGTRPDQDTFIITAQTDVYPIRALRLEVLPDDRLPQKGPGRWDNGNFHLSEVRGEILPSSGEARMAEPLIFARAAADHEGDKQPIAGLIDGKVETYWSIDPRYGEPHVAVLEVTNPVGFTNGSTLVLRLEQQELKGHQVGRFRFSITTNTLAEDLRQPIPAPLAMILRLPEAERTEEQRTEMALQLLGLELERDLAQMPPPQLVYAATREFTPSGSFKPSPLPRPIHLLVRGDINRPGELVSPAALRYVTGLPGEFPPLDPNDEAARRGALAHWLVDRRNVLTWRSIVNRVWHLHFGRGLVETPNDFGKMGSLPSHPELLDWLAVWFRDEANGSLKALHRLILTSETWQQTTIAHQGEEEDWDNRLLWRQNRARLSAEQVRDSMLALSGQLDLRMGGPAAIQFIHRDKATFNTDGAPAFLDYENFDPDSPAARSRAIYRFVFRTVPDPLMDALDCPDGGTMTPVRASSTTAVQALAMLNDHFLIRQCEHLATRLTKPGSTTEEEVTALYRLMLHRLPGEWELNSLAEFSRRHGLANAAHLLMNSNEFMHLD